MIRPPVRLAVALSLPLVLLTAPAATAGWVMSGTPNSGGPWAADNAGGVIIAAGTCSRIDGQGVVQWTSGGLWPSGFTFASDIAPDGSGGAVVALGAGDVYANRVSSSGIVLWGGTGVTVCTATGNQILPAIRSDGAGGAFLAWQDARAGLDDIYAQHINALGIVQWAPNGIPLCTQPGKQRDIAMVPDGSGGAIIAWGDPRAGEANQDIYAQRVDASGTAMWGADGLPVCVAAGVQAVPSLASDGAGGAIITWWDLRTGGRDVYAQRIDASGTALWAANGIPIANGPADEYKNTIVEDGAHGAFLAWEDLRSGLGDIYAQHVDGTGNALWTAGGVPVCAESHAQHDPHIVLDGSGGVEISWSDTRAGASNWDAYAQRLNSAGVAQWHTDGVYVLAGIPPSVSPTDKKLLSDGAGGILVGAYIAVMRLFADGTVAWVLPYRITSTGVVDEPADQGGWVQLRANRAQAEIGFSPTVTAYSVWRRVPGSTSSLAPGTAPDAREVVERARTGPARVESALAAGADFPPGTWETMGSQPAMLLPTYVFAEPTHDDSTAAGPATDVYLIVSHTSTVGVYVVAFPDSGHSVDNLPPLMPQSAGGTSLSTGTVQLHWSPNGERDLLDYAVYKGTSSGFTPSVANRLGTPSSPMWTDAAYDPATSYYKVSAFDRHGNESGYALVTPGQVTGVGSGEIPPVSFIDRPQPNPASSRVTFTYGLSREGPVRLDILDARGRLVRRMLDRRDPPGTRSLTWEGIDDRGHEVAPGIYWVSFTAPETRRVVRLAWLR